MKFSFLAHCPLPPPPTCVAESLSFPLESAKAQTFQKVDRMLQKGTLELVDHQGPGYYSQLFLVQKVLEGWCLLIDLLSVKAT